jgi:crotonobetainyl-CoA:carnitine CoA-transferase CaiB-like acyl-CoA transferase
MENMFAGLRVLDLSTVLAGPSVGTFFAELGATVIKVENPQGGDVTRTWKLKSEKSEANVSAYFASVNYKKSYVALDFSIQSDRLQLVDLIRDADVVLVNFKEGDDIKFRLTADDVRAINPDIIYASLKGFASNPQRIAYDVVLQAECGFMFMNGNDTSGPLKMPVALIDVLAAHQMKEGILCALIQRLKKELGSVVRVTLEQAALSALMNQASNFLMAGHIPQPEGSLHPNIAPYGETFSCGDERQIVLAIGSNSQFAKLCQCISMEELANDSRFYTNQNRVVHRKELSTILQSAIEKEARNYWMKKFIDAGVPAGSIRSMDEIFLGDFEKTMIREEMIAGENTKRVTSIAFSLES